MRFVEENLENTNLFHNFSILPFHCSKTFIKKYRISDNKICSLWSSLSTKSDKYYRSYYLKSLTVK